MKIKTGFGGTLTGLFVLALCGIVRGQDATAPIQRGPFPLPVGAAYPVVTPCFLWRGLPTLEGRINGRPQRFILATGLNAVTVSDAVQAALQLPAAKRSYRVNALDNESEVPAVTLKTLDFGPLSFAGADACVMDVSSLLSPHNPPNTPQCWIGTPLLSTFQITLDIKKGEAVFDSPKAAAPKSDDAITLPLTTQNGRIYVRMTIPGAKPFAALVDTGAPTTIAPFAACEKLKLKPFRTQALRLSRGRKARAASILLPTLQLGTATLKNLPVVCIAGDAPTDFDPNFGLLGMDILGRYRVTINYARAKLTLTPNTAAPETAGDSPPKSP